MIIVDDDGLKGDKGDIGIQGEKGDKGEAGTGLKWKGEWVYGNYEVGDLVRYFDAVDWAVYICISPPVINYRYRFIVCSNSNFIVNVNNYIK